jgi:malonyl-CoA/methylmalonyl-CoA synthetase
MVLPRAWATQWATAAGAPTLRCGAQGPFLSAAELEARTRAVAGQLEGLGLGRGARLLWSTRSSVEGIMVALSALRLGAVLVPVNPRATVDELAYLVTDAQPALCVLDMPEMAAAIRAMPDSPAVSGPTLSGGGQPGELDASVPEDPALIIYTSGTTGQPKGAVLTHANVMAGINALRMAWRWDAGDRLISALPLFHVHGLCVALFGSLAAGGSMVVLDRFDAAEVLEAAGAPGSTLFFGVPTMYHRLLGLDGARVLSGLRLCVSGSAPLLTEEWQRARRVAGIEILERYGMTETMLTISNPLVGERRPGTVGFPLPGVHLQIDGPSGDQAEGELLVRGPSVFSGYWRRPAATAESFTGEWFRTGDVARVDSDGYYAIRGRTGDMIISGGHNVYPAEVEDVLLGHGGVAEVAVVGTPSVEWGEQVTAFVVRADEGTDETLLLAFCAERLAPHKRPRIVHFVDSLPRNALGKILRRELAP